MVVGTEKLSPGLGHPYSDQDSSKKLALPRLANAADEAVNARAEPKLEAVAPSSPCVGETGAPSTPTKISASPI
jgi:hypothetical protein